MARASRSLFLPEYLNHLSVLLPPAHARCQGPRLPAPGTASPGWVSSSSCFPRKGLHSGPAHIHRLSCRGPSSWAPFLSPSWSVAGTGGPAASACAPKCVLHPSTLASPLTKTSPHLTNQNLSKLIFGGPPPPNYGFDGQIEQVNPRSSSPLPPGASLFL